jgi:hypothetical protein
MTMAIAVEMNFPGATAEQYDQVLQKMDLTLGGPMPDGGIAHWCSVTPDGLHIVDIWASREQFDKFAQEQIGPYSAEVGIAEPTMTFYDVHNYLLERI